MLWHSGLLHTITSNVKGDAIRTSGTLVTAFQTIVVRYKRGNLNKIFSEFETSDILFSFVLFLCVCFKCSVAIESKFFFKVSYSLCHTFCAMDT
jgi:hypothetical protein